MKTSFVKKTIHMMAIQCVLLLVVFFSYLILSYRTAADGLEQNMYNLMQIYGKELENKIDNADMLFKSLIYKNTDYDILQSPNSNERYYASMRINNFLEEQTAYDHYIDAVMMAENEYGMCLDYENISMSYKEREALRKYTLQSAGKEQVKAQWRIEEIGQKKYVCKINVWQGKAVGVFISVDSFMKNASESDFEKVTLLLTDQDNVIGGMYGNQLSGAIPGQIWDQSVKNAQGVRYELAGGKLYAYGYISNSEIVGQIRLNMVLMMLVILILVGFSVLAINYLRREILVPMSHMRKSMEEMRDGDYTLRIQEDYSNQEFTLLKDNFNRLMDEIVGLKIESYEKQIDLQETELKCVRLQIRPHFFLNALTTVSSLSQQAKNKEIEQYIAALSKNIRYMFRSGLHTVTLGEEMRHVENYFEMQELKYPNCVFYFSDVPKELEDWRIPQMLVHTIIENEYKYAVSVDSVLTILIKASLTVRQGEKMLLLEIEDDGKGYPEEFLEEFTEKEDTSEQTGQRVGLKSVRRMLELMYERKDLFSIENIAPHGCKNIFFIPAHALHEISEASQR